MELIIRVEKEEEQIPATTFFLYQSHNCLLTIKCYCVCIAQEKFKYVVAN
jgi:hypothetical protein